MERLLLLHLYQEQEEGELVQILGPWWGIVAALVLGTGAGDNSAPSSSVSAIVPHLALLPPPAPPPPLCWSWKYFSAHWSCPLPPVPSLFSGSLTGATSCQPSPPHPSQCPAFSKRSKSPTLCTPTPATRSFSAPGTGGTGSQPRD